MKKNLLLGMLAITATGSALATTSPVLSISNTAATGANTGVISAAAPSLYSYSDSTFAQSTSASSSSTWSKTAIQPTTTQAGLAYDYTRTTTTTTTTNTTWNYDAISWSADSDASLFSGGKYLTLTGSLSSLVSGNVSINLYARGNYNTSPSPFGAVSPGLPAIYFGSSIGELDRLASWNWDSNSQYSTSASTTLQLVEGVAQSFAAVVYASNDVSLDAFDLWAVGPDYNYRLNSTSKTATTDTLTGSHLIPAVPEPETYGMMIGGLGFLGAVARRRRASPGNA